jgi:UDP-glucose 4-epimerase
LKKNDVIGVYQDRPPEAFSSLFSKMSSHMNKTVDKSSFEEMPVPFNPSDYRGMQVLITGGLGFLGSNLALRLVELGAHVIILDGLLEGLGANWFNIQTIREQVQVVEANIGDQHALKTCVPRQDIIFNIGMQPSHLLSMEKPLYDVETNVLSQVRFLEGLRAMNPQSRVLYVGSRAQFGRVEELPITEQTLPNPRDVYAVSKQAVEWYHFQYAAICGLRITALRLGNTYGPRHQMQHSQYGVQNYLIRLALEGKEIQVYGDGKQMREMIYVDDAVDAFLRLAMFDHCAGETYCIGARERVSFLHLVDAIIRSCGSGSYRQVPWPQDRESIEVGDVMTDDSKLRAHTQWEPQISLEQGLEKTIVFYREHRRHYW